MKKIDYIFIFSNLKRNEQKLPLKQNTNYN